MRVWLLSLCAVGCLVACGGRRAGGGGPPSDGGVGHGDAGPRPDGAVVPPADGGTPSDCAAEARWVYLLDDGNVLMRFQPDDLSLTPIGTLDCGSPVTPFSMAVTRDAVAWVLFQDGRLYHVSTTDARCTPTAFTPNQMGFELFGMGFVSDTAGSSAETLHISGGASASVGMGGSTLGTIDGTSLAVRTIGGLPGWPELTGTGSGELWGFFPDTTPRSVRQIDKTSGATPVTFPLDALGTDTARSWAFAFWGGRYYVFLKRMSDASTKIWRLDPSDGSLEEVVSDTGYSIVGAGVSTCAPVELI